METILIILLLLLLFGGGGFYWSRRGRQAPRSEMVVNRQSEKVGKIHDLVMDAREHRAAYAVFSQGGDLQHFCQKDCSLQVCFFRKYESEVAGSTLPGMDETATLGGSTILQTHG